MDTLTKLMFSLQGLIWVGVLIILVYLIFRRIRLQKNENFEDRTN